MQATQLVSPKLIYYDQYDRYCLGPQETAHAAVEHSAICGNFIRRLLGKAPFSQVPKEIRLVVDTEPIPDSLPITFGLRIDKGKFYLEWNSDHPDLKAIAENDETMFPTAEHWLRHHYIGEGDTIYVALKI